MKGIRALCAKYGMEIIKTVPVKEHWKKHTANLNRADLVIVNAEGTIHHSRAKYLVDIAKTHNTAIINGVFENLGPEFTAGLQAARLVTARESTSAEYLRKWHGVDCRVVPDVIFHHARRLRLRRPPTIGRQGIFDSVVNPHPKGMGVTDYRDYGKYKKILTGRFHGICMALIYGVPLTAYPSNTWKNLGLMRDAGLFEAYAPSAGDAARIEALNPDPLWALNAAQQVDDLFCELASPPQKGIQSYPTTWLNVHAGKPAVVLGNGPSIGDMDLSVFKKKRILTFGTNSIGDKYTPTYYVVTDRRAWLWYRAMVYRAQKAGSIPVLFHKLTKKKGRIIPINYMAGASATFGVPTMGGPIYHGRTVGIVALHLAYQMGCNPIYMLGIDGFGQPEGNTHYHDHHKDERDKVKDKDERDVVVREALRRLVLAFKRDGRTLIDLSTRSLWDGVVPKGKLP